MPEENPKQIGRYQVVGELGRGGFSRVYRAYDPAVGRPVALKVLTDVSGGMLTRFQNEAKVAGNLRHTNIVTVYEYGAHEGAPFLAMEYLEGEDLHRVIASRKPLNLSEKCSIMSQVADGLHYAHSSGVIHRDIKPANIMVLPGGAVKIMDFGIARLARTPDATRLTQQGYLIGTLRYMAPEQLTNAGFDVRSDIFAYGLIFYELLTGRHPFEAPDAQSLMYKLSFGEPAPIGELAPGVPEPLQQMILRMVHRDRDQRYQSLGEIRFDLEPMRIELQRARASELLIEARALFEEDRLEPAQQVLQEALSLDAGNSAARELWEEVQQTLQKRILQPRIEGLLSAAEEHLVNRRFAEAAQAFESALALDTRNTQIRRRAGEARVQMEHASKALELLAEARREFEGDNLTAAYRIISEALRYDPRNPEATEFLKAIESYAERRQAEQRVDSAIRKAQGLMLISAYDEAIAVLTASGHESPQIEEWLTRVRTEQAAYETKQKLRREIAAATDLLRAGQLVQAAARLEILRKDFPENREVEDLFAYAQKEQAAFARANAIESAAADVAACAQRKDFEGAFAIIDTALKKHPADSGLIRLLSNVMAEKNEWEREHAVQTVVAMAVEPRSSSLAGQPQAEWKPARRSEPASTVPLRAEQLTARLKPERARMNTRSARPRIQGLIAGSAAAVSLAGGIFAFRARRPSEVALRATTNTPGPATAVVTLPAAPPSQTPAVLPSKAEKKAVSPAATPAQARMEISGAIAGASVRVDGQWIGETDRNGSIRHELAPGVHIVELTRDDYTPVRVTEQFRSGKTVRLDHARVAMSFITRQAPAPAPAPPAPPDPKQIEAQQWAQIASSSNPDDFDDFVRNHPASPHTEQARSRALELRQQIRARAAEQLDQASWEKVDRKNRGQLEDYLARFPSGMHVQEARARITDLDREAAEALAAQRLREQKDQEQAKRAADQQAIVKTLTEFEAAYNRRDLAAMQRIWNALPAAKYRQQFHDARDLQFQLQLIGQPEVSGNSAVALCTRTTNYRGQSGGAQTHSEHVKLTLGREGSGWVIRSIELN